MKPPAVLAILLLLVVPARAHEVRPAYLELHEETAGEYSVLWKTPMQGEMRLALEPEFSGRTEVLGPGAHRVANDASVRTWRLRAIDALRGQTLRISGLAGTMTDALVRIEFVDGTGWTQRLTPGQPSATIPVHQGVVSVAGVYLKLGVAHILTGFDHLLFVLALLLGTTGGWTVIKTVTAFTVAHSITLALATLGVLQVPPAPVEAVIALSIVLVAREIIRARRGMPGLTTRAPWVVAFMFGLLHGLGFAGALREVGLPQGRIPLALLSFNLGVEAGQLVFIASVLSVVGLFRRLRVSLPERAALAPTYAIGMVAMFLVIQRVMSF